MADRDEACSMQTIGGYQVQRLMKTQQAKHSKGPMLVAVGTGGKNVSLTPAQFTERMATRFYRKDWTRKGPSNKSRVVR